jgi:O-antigen/teichoic acid export membrane protein
VLGDRWIGTTEIMQILVLASLAGLLGDSLVPLLQGTGRPEKIVTVDAFQLVMIAGLGWGMIGAFGVVGAGMAYLTSIILSQFLIVYILYKTIEKPFSGFLSSLLAMVIVALIGAVVAFSMMALIPGAFGVGLAAFVAGLTAIGAGLVFDRYFDLGLLKILSEPFPQLGAAVDNYIRGK